MRIDQYETLIAGTTNIRDILKNSKNEKEFRKNMKKLTKCMPKLCGKNVIQQLLLISLYNDCSRCFCMKDDIIKMLSSDIKVLELGKRAEETMQKYKAEMEKLQRKNLEFPM